jgi:peptidoglycan/xylan/chitin deacetylase (PgdA/CDA1 family)
MAGVEKTNMTKSILKNFILKVAENSGFLNILQKTNLRNGQYVYILTYHRVAELTSRPWLTPGLISATPQQFDEQMKLVANKYNPISVQDLVRAAQGGGSLPKDAVLVTVDDGYRDFKEEIFPVCSRYSIRPLLFMPTAFVGTGNFWWDKVYQIIHLSGLSKIDTPIGKFSITNEREKSKTQEQLIPTLKLMPFEKVTEWVDSTHSALVQLTEEQQHNTLTWDELRQLDFAGVTVACHTHTHPILTQISLEEAQREVSISQELICQELGHALPIFAFPDGKPHAYNHALFQMLNSEGFEMLFLLVDGRALIQSGNKKMILPRLSVWQSQTLPQFHMRLTPLWALYETINYKNRKVSSWPNP